VPEQIVNARNRTGNRIFDRQKREFDRAVLYGGGRIVESSVARRFRARYELASGIVAERAGLTLIRDPRHPPSAQPSMSALM